MDRITKLSLNLWPRPLKLTKREYTMVDEVIKLEEQTKNLKISKLRKRVREIRQEIKNGEPLSNFLIEGFSLVREVAFRTIQMKHYPVQILAGLVLFRGGFAEMATGEGKTLTATLPIFMWALCGEGVHVLTTNSYLTERDFELMSPVYKSLGFTAGLLRQDDSPKLKKIAYDCDITYGVGPDYGFDYMRDQLEIMNRRQTALGMKFKRSLYGLNETKPFKMQRPHAFALIDEVDSVIIDEARSPLVISGAKGGPAKDAYIYVAAEDIAIDMEEDIDFTINKRQIELEDPGIKKMYVKKAPKGLIYPWSFYIKQALNAHFFFKRDVHYMIGDGKVIIVDEFTGRRFEERTWRDGLHQAIEAKEKIEITEASKSVARITRQRYFALYDTIAGMTGTARGSEKELWQFYNSAVTCIPLRKTSQRKVLPDCIYGSSEQKWNEIEERILEIHKTEQPLLIGTKTIESSEYLAHRLEKHELEVQVLNAKQDEYEADIISRAGQKGMITIATNMAGRGTDISLGEGVVALGGLFVLGTERHESRRVDNQLIGRCARQGNPGTAQFFVSFEDDLIVANAPKLSEKMKKKGKLGQRYASVFENMQRHLDLVYFEQRKNMFRFDDWIEDVLKMIG